jgi:endonuclease/exonuclease/phosphatase family metal-dependent hydrolase
MKLNLFLLSFLISYTLLFSTDYISIGTFNIEWLGDGIDDHKPRGAKEYAEIARIIKECDADILALQEIENQDAINKVLKYLKGYSAKIIEGGGKQNLGVLYKSNITISDIRIYNEIAVIPYRTRAGMFISAKKGNFDFNLMNIHLKSTSSHDNTQELKELSYKIRNAQWQQLNAWADSIMKFSSERDLIILGDFNDHPKKENSQILPLKSKSKFEFLTIDLKSCLFSNWWAIDNIVVTKSAKKRFLEGSLRVEDFRAYVSDDLKRSISDHCPVIAKFEVSSEDND